MGNFKEAEHYLSNAIAKAFPSYGALTMSSLPPTVEPAFLKLQMARGIVLLKGFSLDKGLELLQSIEKLKERLSYADVTTLLEALALVSYVRILLLTLTGIHTEGNVCSVQRNSQSAKRQIKRR